MEDSQESIEEPAEENEVCYFSVPADPIDVQRDTVYHEGVFNRILTQLGYDAIAGNEAQAIVFSECVKEDFTGIGISFGSGMTNVSLVLKAMPCIEF